MAVHVDPCQAVYQEGIACLSCDILSSKPIAKPHNQGLPVGLRLASDSKSSNTFYGIQLSQIFKTPHGRCPLRCQPGSLVVRLHGKSGMRNWIKRLLRSEIPAARRKDRENGLLWESSSRCENWQDLLQ